MQPFAQDMGYDGEPFIWNPNRRALLRAELDAYYTKLYQLTRDELRYILDSADVYGADFPSETFRVLLSILALKRNYEPHLFSFTSPNISHLTLTGLQ